MTEAGPLRICFVCLGNICRSPTAEAVMASLVADAGLAAHIEVDSAGTAGWHEGKPPDERARAEALRRNIPMTSRARRLTRADLDRFDHVIVMDRKNLGVVQSMVDGAEASRAEVSMMLEFASTAPGRRDVADPYYGDDSDFAAVFDVVTDACAGLLAHLRERHDLGP